MKSANKIWSSNMLAVIGDLQAASIRLSNEIAMRGPGDNCRSRPGRHLKISVEDIITLSPIMRTMQVFLIPLFLALYVSAHPAISPRDGQLQKRAYETYASNKVHGGTILGENMLLPHCLGIIG
jgi:hypothetical protein